MTSPLPSPLPGVALVPAPGGRVVGTRLAGASEGPLVIYMHGAPSSRLDVEALHERSVRRGVCLVGIDRPGFGRSTPMPFTFQSVARDAGLVACLVGGSNVHAVVVRESGDRDKIEASAALVETNVAPTVARAPGFVSALWMSDGAGGTLNVIVFESESAARAALDAARNAPRPPFMRVEQVALARVLATA